jgi:ATP-binding cassette subfamily F protein 3
MSILSANNLCLSFGDFDLFRGINVSIANDSKIGLIGPNGVGKTSLLMILAGINPPTSGEIFLARGKRIGYLRQEAIEAFADRSNTVYAEMLRVFTDLLDQQARMNELEAQMSAGDHSEKMLEQYGSLQHAFESAGGYELDLRIQQTLQGLGLGKETWEMPLAHLSGGQKTRALLARLLLEQPDLLFLDEPTNHLDIDAVEWLEHALEAWHGAILIVSHDRYFLDSTVNTIWEMTPSTIYSYSGGYSAYLVQREERWEYYERVFEEEKARLLHEVDFIQRNWVRASTHARALGQLRRISRDIAIAQTYGVMAFRSGKKWSEMDLHVERPLDVIEAVRAVNAIQPEMPRPPRLRPRLTSQQVSGNLVIRLEKATIGWPGNPLFQADAIELRRGECAALIGPNGSGKTTLLKTLLGQVPPLKGEARLGSSLKVGYFAQAHDGLNGAHSVLEELNEHKEMLPEQGRAYLAPYLFRGEDVFKPVSALSGGERARLALALLALDGANLLLLDEPTNHLDIPAQEALQEVLQDFPGTILLVSHDRFFIDKLATQIWDLRGGKLYIYQGTYRQYTLSRISTSPATQPARLLLAAKPILQGNEKQSRRQAQNLALLEERIHEAEDRLKALYKQLERAYAQNAGEQIRSLSLEAATTQGRLEELMGQWEKEAA